MRSSAIFSFALLFLTLWCSGHEATGQTPRIIPTARLLTPPNEVSTASRPRRVFAFPASGLPSLSEANEIERRAFESTNVARAENGLAPLAWDPALCQVARTHSASMGRQGYFAHETPDGSRLRDRVRVVGIAHFRVLGENIAYNQGYDDPGAFAVERWMISAGHRANILSREFDRSAIGSFVAADGSVYLTQVFIKY